VPAAVLEFYREATKTVVTVDQGSLARIRREALATQESLIVEEHSGYVKLTGQGERAGLTEQKDNPVRELFDPFDDFSDNQPLAPFNASSGETSGYRSETGTVSNSWESLKGILNDIELKALTAVRQGGDLKVFADECGIMPEVLADGINEKAVDCIGDNLMDDVFVLYDDYRQQVQEITG
jgi:hypothetical protein